MHPRRGFTFAVAAILVLALSVRLVIAVESFDRPLASDPADYDRHARSIAAGEWYPESGPAGGGPTAIRPPTFPLLLGGVYALPGDGADAGLIAQALIGVLVVALLGLVARELWDRSTALAAMGLAAVYPPLLLVGSTLLSEPLFLVLELAALMAALVQRRSSGVRWACAAGVCAGLAILTRTTGFLLLPPLVLLVVRGGAPWLRALAPGAALVAVAALTVAPWTVRNAVVMDAFVPVSTQGGITAAGTYNETSRRDPRFPAVWRVPTLDPANGRAIADPGLDEVAINRILGRRARRFALDHPGYVAEVLYWNGRRLVHLDAEPFSEASARGEMNLGPTAAHVGDYGFYVVALLAFAGALLPPARRVPKALWLFPALLATVVFIRADPRYRLPVDAFLILLAAVALAAVGRRLAGRRDAILAR